MKICSVTGHRPSGFPWNYRDKECLAHSNYLSYMEEKISKLISIESYNYFIAGGAIGVDTDFAKTVLSLRDTIYPHIQLEIAVPCKNQDLKWTSEDKAVYNQILAKANVVNVLNQHYTSFCMQKRNEYMVMKSDLVLAFYNANSTKGGTYNTIKLMQRKKINFELLYLQAFTDTNKIDI